jgi:hypothetical protein
MQSISNEVFVQMFFFLYIYIYFISSGQVIWLGNNVSFEFTQFRQFRRLPICSLTHSTRSGLYFWNS